MNEMKLKLSPGFLRGIVTRLIAKLLYEKVGYKINVELNELEVSNANGKVRLHVDVNADMDNAEFAKLMKSVGLG